MRDSITQSEWESLNNEILRAEELEDPLPAERYHEIIRGLLKKILIYGYAPYNSEFGDNKICECDHPYHRHFDSYEEMSPCGCKYCRCDQFILKTENKSVCECGHPEESHTEEFEGKLVCKYCYRCDKFILKENKNV